MRTLKTSEAAAMLRVSPNTLRAWEERFGYPKPRRSPGRHRLYVFAEIDALRQALEDGLSISSAISVVVEALSADARALVIALSAFRDPGADAAMESSLQLRSMERTVEEVLLPALTEIRRRKGVGSATWCHAADWATDWLRRARRLAPTPAASMSVLIGDASGQERDASTPYLRAFELFCARGGARVLSLPVSALHGLSDAVAASSPHVLVIAGHVASDSAVAQWAYNARSQAGEAPIALYRRALAAGSGKQRTVLLPSAPSAARDEVIAMADPPRVQLSPRDSVAGQSVQPRREVGVT